MNDNKYNDDETKLILDLLEVLVYEDEVSEEPFSIDDLSYFSLDKEIMWFTNKNKVV